MKNFDWQWIIVGLLLNGAVYYVFRTVKRSFTSEHNCPDCGIAPDPKKMKNSLPKN
jgi:hypothetical protein